MDWYSRYVLAWRLSNTLDVVLHGKDDALEEALTKGTPEIFNTDQGSQFTSEAFTGILLKHGIQISMDGKGRYKDNIFVERLWRSLKYEEVYLKSYQRVPEARAGIGAYLRFYNEERPHQALGYRTPWEVFETKSSLEGVVDDAKETITAPQELERGCPEDQELVSFPWLEPDPRVMVTKNTAGDSLSLAPSLSRLLGPPQPVTSVSSLAQRCPSRFALIDSLQSLFLTQSWPSFYSSLPHRNYILNLPLVCLACFKRNPSSRGVTPMKVAAPVREREKVAETTKEWASEAGEVNALPGLLAVEGEQVLHCAMCRREVKVWWFVDHAGLITFGLSPAADDEARYRQWLEDTPPTEHERE